MAPTAAKIFIIARPGGCANALRVEHGTFDEGSKIHDMDLQYLLKKLRYI